MTVYKKWAGDEKLNTRLILVGAILCLVGACWSGKSLDLKDNTPLVVAACTLIMGLASLICFAFMYGAILYRRRLFNNADELGRELFDYIAEVKSELLPEIWSKGKPANPDFSIVFRLGGCISARGGSVPVRKTLLRAIVNMQDEADEMSRRKLCFSRNTCGIMAVASEVASAEDSMERWIKDVRAAIAKGKQQIEAAVAPDCVAEPIQVVESGQEMIS